MAFGGFWWLLTEKEFWGRLFFIIL